MRSAVRHFYLRLLGGHPDPRPGYNRAVSGTECPYGTLDWRLRLRARDRGTGCGALTQDPVEQCEARAVYLDGRKTQIEQLQVSNIDTCTHPGYLLAKQKNCK